MRRSAQYAYERRFVVRVYVRHGVKSSYDGGMEERKGAQSRRDAAGGDGRSNSPLTLSPASSPPLHLILCSSTVTLACDTIIPQIACSCLTYLCIGISVHGMPLIPFTPESLQPHRSDSKNPATTCKGLCTSGRPCRRSLATPSKSLADPFHISLASGETGTSVSHDKVSTSFCWQHKDQALGAPVDAPSKSTSLPQRSSIDTLVDRLGNITLRDASIAGDHESQLETNRSNRDSRAKPDTSRRQHTPHGQSRRKNSFWASLCCVPEKDEDDYLGIVRHKKRAQQSSSREEKVMTTSVLTKAMHVSPAVGIEKQHDFPHTKMLQTDTRDVQAATSNLSWIPESLSSVTRDALAKELFKPISPTDTDGYIYMFWLTDSNSQAPSPTAITSTLSPPTSPHHPGVTGSPLAGDMTTPILLKIGRTSNVHRRMNEWTRQCDYNLTLVRFYPYVSVSSGVSLAGIRQVPYSRRVERLIHIELADKRVKRGKCTVCQKEHREWFQVEASRKGLKGVDESIRRWVKWAEETKQEQGQGC